MQLYLILPFLFILNCRIHALLIPAGHDWSYKPEFNGTCKTTAARGPLSIHDTFWSVWVIVGGQMTDLLNPRLFDDTFQDRVCNWTIRFGNSLRMRQTADLSDYDKSNMVLPRDWSVKCAYYENDECIDIGMRYCCKCTDECVKQDMESQERMVSTTQGTNIAPNAGKSLAQAILEMENWILDNISGFKKYRILRLVSKFDKKAKVISYFNDKHINEI